MRLFFLLLLLMNVGFFVWFYQQGVFSNDTVTTAPVIAQTDPGVQKLVLVSEQQAQEEAPPPREVPPPVATASTSTSPVSERCVVAGPWPDRDLAEQAQAAAGEAGIPALIEEVEHEVAAGSWVVLEGRYEIGEARALLREMQAQGISDVAITPMEDGRHLISLGLFSRQSTLENRRQEILRAGYVPEVRQRTRTEPAWTVLLALEAADLAPMSELLERLIEMEPRTQWRDIECR